jgi:hypothetical protein
LRQMASGKFLSASTPGIYTWDESAPTTSTGRRLRAEQNDGPDERPLQRPRSGQIRGLK